MRVSASGPMVAPAAGNNSGLCAIRIKDRSGTTVRTPAATGTIHPAAPRPAGHALHHPEFAGFVHVDSGLDESAGRKCFNPNSEAETANLRSSPLIPSTLGGRRPEVFCSDVVAASLCHQRRLAQISGSKSFSGLTITNAISPVITQQFWRAVWQPQPRRSILRGPGCRWQWQWRQTGRGADGSDALDVFRVVQT